MKKFLNFRLPTYGESNVKWFYIISAFANAWFQAGNWFIFVLLFMSVSEFAIYEAVAFGLGILIEIPSGAIDDLFGRKRTVVTAMWMMACGSIIFTIGPLGDGFFFWGNILIIAAFALKSGSLEALVYDTLVEKGKAEYYDDILGKAKSLGLVSIVSASLLGGIAWTFSVYGPWILTSAAFVIGALAAHKLVEPKIETEKPTIKLFLAQSGRGFHYLFRSEFKKYTLSLALVTGSFYMWHTGIIRVLMGEGFGYDGQTINYLIAATLLAGAVAAYFFRAIRKKFGDRIGFASLLALAGLAWLGAGILAGSILLGAVVFAVISVTGVLSETWASVILNKHVHSKDRATAISTLSFLLQIPYVFTVVLFGNLAQAENTNIFYVVTGAMLFLGMASFYIAERPKTSKFAPQKPVV